MNRRIITFKGYFEQFLLSLTEKGFQKKTQKTPAKEIEKALRIKEEYYEYKRQLDK